MADDWSNTITLAEKKFDILDYGAVAGPKRELAVRLVTDMVLAAGDTIITGTMTVKRNRYRGQWRPGWIASCKAVQDGQAFGLGTMYSFPKGSRFIYFKPKQVKIDWTISS